MQANYQPITIHQSIDLTRRHIADVKASLEELDNCVASGEYGRWSTTWERLQNELSRVLGAEYYTRHLEKIATAHR